MMIHHTQRHERRVVTYAKMVPPAPVEKYSTKPVIIMGMPRWAGVKMSAIVPPTTLVPTLPATPQRNLATMDVAVFGALWSAASCHLPPAMATHNPCIKCHTQRNASETRYTLLLVVRRTLTASDQSPPTRVPLPTA